jgi:hypothetical protein
MKYSNTNNNSAQSKSGVATSDFFTACKEGHVQVVESMLKGIIIVIQSKEVFSCLVILLLILYSQFSLC